MGKIGGDGMKEVYAAEYCDCIYESGFGVISLHQTKAGAYKAMREHLMGCHLTESTWINGQYRRNYYSACSIQRWKVTTYKVMQ